MNGFKDKFARFMYGRYGMDQLSEANASAVLIEDEKPTLEVDKMYTWRNYFPCGNLSNRLRKSNKA